MSPMECSVVPPSLRARSAIANIGHGEDLVRVLIQEQMVIAEMRAAHVPVKIFRLQIQREDIR